MAKQHTSTEKVATIEEESQTLQEAWNELQAVPSYVERPSVNEEYYCGLCGQMMPLSHFPH